MNILFISVNIVLVFLTLFVGLKENSISDGEQRHKGNKWYIRGLYILIALSNITLVIVDKNIKQSDSAILKKEFQELKSERDSLRVLVSYFHHLTQDSLRRMGKENFANFHKLQNAQQSIALETMKRTYPLEPLTLIYEFEIPFDKQYFKDFAEKLKASYREKGKKIPNSRVNISESEEYKELLKNSNLHYVLQSLYEGETVFKFANPNNQQSYIGFIGVKDTITGGYVYHKPIKGIPGLDITVEADFINEVFRKKVTAKNPIRVGADNWTSSRVDLIGKNMSYEILNVSKELKLVKFRFLFPNSYQESTRFRKVNMFKVSDKDQVIINAKMIGMDEILKNQPIQLN